MSDSDLVQQGKEGHRVREKYKPNNVYDLVKIKPKHVNSKKIFYNEKLKTQLIICYLC